MNLNQRFVVLGFVSLMLFSVLLVPFTLSSAATTTVVFKPTGAEKYVGESVNVVGNGWPSSTTVTISIERASTSKVLLAIMTETNARGHFSTSFVVPNTFYQGTYQATVSGGGLTQFYNVKIEPKLYVSSASVAPGGSIVLSGNGLSPSSALKFRSGAGFLAVLPVITNSTSGFSETVNVPSTTTAGTYTIKTAAPFEASVTVKVS